MTGYEYNGPPPTDAQEAASGCPPHRFLPRTWRWLRRAANRYRCFDCGLITRHYDGLDRWMSRPIHKSMSVAYKGVNTIGRDPIK